MQRPAWTPSVLPTMEEMVDRYGDDLLRLCLLYLGDRQLAEDAFQETMVKAWRALSTFRGKSSLRMMKKSAPLSERRKLPRRRTGKQGCDAGRAHLAGQVPRGDVLYYFEDMKLREIADVLNTPVNSVSTRLRRARALLEKVLKGGVMECKQIRRALHEDMCDVHGQASTIRCITPFAPQG